VAVFKDGINAIKAALEVLESMKTCPKKNRCDIRIGIHSGETKVDKDKDRYGATVVAANRMESIKLGDKKTFHQNGIGRTLPDKNRILVSYAIASLIEGGKIPNATSQYLGTAELKGFHGIEYKVFLVKRKPSRRPTTPPPT